MVVPKDMPLPKSLLHQTSIISSTATSDGVSKEIPSIQTTEGSIVSREAGPIPSKKGTSGLEGFQKGIDSLIERIVENEQPSYMSGHIPKTISSKSANIDPAQGPGVSTSINLTPAFPVISTYSFLYNEPGPAITSTALPSSSVYIDLDSDTNDEYQNTFPGTNLSSAMPAMPLVRSGPQNYLPPLPLNPGPALEPSNAFGMLPSISDSSLRQHPADSDTSSRVPPVYVPPIKSYKNRPRGPRPTNFNKELYGLYRNQLVLKKFICPHCGRRCLKKSDLTRHIRVHTGEKPYACELCLKRFGEKHNFYNHMRRAHPDYCQ